MLFDIPFVADWQKIGDYRQCQTDHSNISENNKPVSRSVFAYDKNGNLILVKVLDNTEKMVDNRVYTYTYDSQNNWIKKEIKINDKPAYIVERTVTYY